MKVNCKNALKKLEKILLAVNDHVLLVSLRESLINLIPVLMVGTFALVCRSFPVAAYQNWLVTAFHGNIYNFFQGIYQATFGLLSVYMTISFSLRYSSYKGAKDYGIGAVLSAVAAFAICSGVMSSADFNLGNFGANGMFTAIASTGIAVWLYVKVWNLVNFSLRLFTSGIDATFDYVFKAIIPLIVVVISFSGVNVLIMQVYGVDCFQTWFAQVLSGLFENMGNSFGVKLLFVFLQSLMWFFGIHGNNVLNVPKDVILGQAMQSNIDAVAAGRMPTEIFTSTFFDAFVLLGGCGATWALLIAIFLFSKRRSNRAVSKVAAIPMLFNINEMIIFGLPIVGNPVFFIPFLLTPLLMIMSSYLAMYLGIVPLTIERVEWTTPIIFSGYLATGSIAGSLLQLFDLVLGVAIYAPFVKIYDRVIERETKEKMNHLVDRLKKSEDSREPIKLLAMKNEYGNIAKNLADELDRWIKNNEVTLYYQPQHNAKGELIGAEALLRWKHPVYGMIYPPLVIKLAEESGNLVHLEEAVFSKAVEDMQKMTEILGKVEHISVNVTGTVIQGDEFEEYLKELRIRYPEVCKHILIEITEQAALRIDDPFIQRLTRLRQIGYVFGIDDFSMGNTSIKYLQSNVFSLVKLDGGISRNVLDNKRSQEIVSSIAQLTHDLGISVLAEYVETEQQRQVLEDAGCYLYQGYLYSPAIPLTDFIEKYK